MAGRLSVWPPESASAVTSSAIGTLRGQLGLLGGDVARGDQLARASRPAAGDRNLRRHLDARHLGDDAVRRDDAAVGVAADAGDAVAHDRQRQVEVRRRLDAAARPGAGSRSTTAASRSGSLRAVDQVEAVRQRRPSVCCEAVDGRARRAASDRPAAPKKPSMPARPIASTISAERDAVGHRPGDVGVAQPVVAQNDGSPRFSARQAGTEARHPSPDMATKSGHRSDRAPPRGRNRKATQAPASRRSFPNGHRRRLNPPPTFLFGFQ